MAEVVGGRRGQLKSSGLRPGWTTGACAAAAATAAWVALHTGEFPDPVRVLLPKGHEPEFALTQEELADGVAMAAVQKDAGDDPDVTHGAVVRARVRRGAPGTGIEFRGGPGVGRVTLPGLPLAVGEPAINPGPRGYIAENLARASARLGVVTDAVVEVSVDGGEELARRTWNPRIGIEGGISILGTTGIVEPMSEQALVDTIHVELRQRRANGADYVLLTPGNYGADFIRASIGLDPRTKQKIRSEISQPRQALQSVIL